MDWDKYFGPLRITFPALHQYEGDTYRCLFIPSFHPTVGITVYGGEQDPWVEVKSGSQPYRARIQKSSFAQLRVDCHFADNKKRAPSGHVCIDGVMIEFSSRTEQGTVRITTVSPREGDAEFKAIFSVLEVSRHAFPEMQILEALTRYLRP